MYSLGIIFFELCHPPFTTGMERQKVIQDLRMPDIVFPKTFNTELKQVYLHVQCVLDYHFITVLYKLGDHY